MTETLSQEGTRGGAADDTAGDDENGRRGRAARKSSTAYRTISEVSTELQVPQHVLRFWETKFSQVRPLKRGGGRRYYRPEDVSLLKQIQTLLYDEGFTIKGVQKLLREGRATDVADNGSVDLLVKPGMSQNTRQELSGILNELKAVRRLLKGNQPPNPAGLPGVPRPR